MSEKSDVDRYKKIVRRIVDKWQKETEKELAAALDSIAKEIEKLEKYKDHGPDEKKQ